MNGRFDRNVHDGQVGDVKAEVKTDLFLRCLAGQHLWLTRYASFLKNTNSYVTHSLCIIPEVHVRYNQKHRSQDDILNRHGALGRFHRKLIHFGSDKLQLSSLFFLFPGSAVGKTTTASVTLKQPRTVKGEQEESLFEQDDNHVKQVVLPDRIFSPFACKCGGWYR